MANPQIENGYTAVANEILDNLYKFSLNGTELKVISCIFRYTFGFHRKSHKLSASFIARWGNCDLRAVKRALKKLQQDRIIICINSEQRGVTAELMFNKNYEQWCTGGQNVTVMTYKRDKSLPDNERLLIISKNRLTGRLALGEKAIKLYYDEASKRISDNCEEFRKPYGWETDQDGFVPVDSIKQMEIPFCD